MLGFISRFRRALACWVWAPLVGKGLLWVGAFAALAQVGKGTVANLMAPRPPPLVAIAMSTMVAAVPPKPPASVAPCASSKSARTADGKIILNQATIEDLVQLPGIGKKRAQAIVALRQRMRRFRRLRDLLRVRGLGFRSLKRLAPLVVIDAPKKAPQPNAKK